MRKYVCSIILSLAFGTAAAQSEKPQYGGTLNIGTVFVTLSPLSWDPGDWPWKFTNDTGLTYEQLFAADLSKSVRNGGRYPFQADAWLPSDAIRGELAESWQWKDNPLRVEIKLRKGVMFPAKPGVMAARELTADDVVFSYNRLDKSPKKIPTYFETYRRSRPPTSTQSCSHSAITTRNGTTASAGATTRGSFPRKWPTREQETGRT